MADFFDDPYDANYDFSFLDDYIYGIAQPKNISNQGEDGFFEPDEEESAPVQEENDGASETASDGAEDQSMTDYLLEQEEGSFFDSGDYTGMPPNILPGSVRGNSSQPGNSKFQNFGSYEEGKAALINQLELYQTGRTRNKVGPNSTLLQAMSVYAPASDRNDPKGYASFIAKKLGVSVDTPISQIDTKQWAAAIEKMEGNKVGNNPGNLKRIKRAGGSVARTKEQQRIGLNNESLDELILPLQGQNPIRGLDSYQPVAVHDQNGNSTILIGPEDIAFMNGPVFEKRLR